MLVGQTSGQLTKPKNTKLHRPSKLVSAKRRAGMVSQFKFCNISRPRQDEYALTAHFFQGQLRHPGHADHKHYQNNGNEDETEQKRAFDGIHGLGRQRCHLYGWRHAHTEVQIVIYEHQ